MVPVIPTTTRGRNQTATMSPSQLDDIIDEDCDDEFDPTNISEDDGEGDICVDGETLDDDEVPLSAKEVTRRKRRAAVANLVAPTQDVGNMDAKQQEQDDIELDPSDTEEIEGQDELVEEAVQVRRGHRNRSGVDYTCLNIMLFGLPSEAAAAARPRDNALTTGTTPQARAADDHGGKRCDFRPMEELEAADSDWEAG